jgi:hypothetical protein
MAQTVTRAALSASTNGGGIKIGATSTPGTLIHTAVSGTSSWDAIFISLYNSAAVTTLPVLVTIEFGGATAPDQNISLYVYPKTGLVWAVQGLMLQNALTVKVFADTTNVIVASGYVNQIV